MASYPGSIVSLTNPQGTNLLTSPDHGALHTSENNEIVAIETMLGTTGGTSVLKNFAAGQFAMRIDNSSIMQSQPQGGTMNNMVLGTPSITGGTLQSTIQNNGILVNGVYNSPTLQAWNGWLTGEAGTMLGTLSGNGIITGTLQVAATASNKYDKGDKVNFTQGGTNIYAYVYSIPSGTTLLITGGTDFQLGTTAITNLQYSKVATPNGFPGTFNYNPNETYSGTAPTGNTKRVAQFSMKGNMVYVRFYASYGTGASSTQMTINQPIPSLESASIYHDFMYGALGTADNTAFLGMAIGAVILFSNTVIQNGPYGVQANKSAYIQGFYSV